MTRPRFTNCGSVIPRSMNLRVCSLTPAMAMSPIFIGDSFLYENLTKTNQGHAGYDCGLVRGADRRAQRAVEGAGEIPQERRVEGVKTHHEARRRARGDEPPAQKLRSVRAASQKRRGKRRVY